MEDFLIGQYYPVNSLLHRLDCRSKLISLGLFTAGIVMADNFTRMSGFLFLIPLVPFVARIPWRVLVKSMTGLFWLLAISVAVPALFGSGQPIVTLGPVSLRGEGLQQGGLTACKLLTMMVLTAVLTLTTRPVDLAEGMERLLAPLGKLKMPVHQLATIIMLALGFIPVLLEETSKIINARKSRGASFGNGTLTERMQSGVGVLVPLLLSTLRRADQLALAMEARGYRGSVGRTRLKELHWRRADTCLVIISTLPIIWLYVSK